MTQRDVEALDAAEQGGRVPLHRSGAVASFLSFLLPGLGQAVAGAWGRGLLIALPVLLLAGAVIGVYLTDRALLARVLLNPTLLLVVVGASLLLMAYRLWAIVDAFGHQVADFSMRLVLMRATWPDLPIAFASRPDLGYHSRDSAPPWFGAILDWLGVPAERVRIITAPTRVRELYVAPQAEQLGGPGPGGQERRRPRDRGHARRHPRGHRSTAVARVRPPAGPRAVPADPADAHRNG